MNPFQIDLSWEGILLFIIAGISTGIINTLAGSGSLVTLPIFMAICHLPPSIANATNRIGVLLQSSVASIQFSKQQPGLYRKKFHVLIPTIVGAIVGSKIALDITEEAMNISLAILMFSMLIILVIKPERWLIKEKENPSGSQLATYISYFFLGVYGGFIQAGAGFFILAGLVLISRYTLSQANGLKIFIILIFTIPAIAIFAWGGKIHYTYGFLMGIFQALGSWIGVRFIGNLPNANLWIYRILLITVFSSTLYFIYQILL